MTVTNDPYYYHHADWERPDPMTVGKLREALAEYPPDAEIEVIMYCPDGSAIFSAVTGLSEGHKGPNLFQFFVGIEGREGKRHV